MLINLVPALKKADQSHLRLNRMVLNKLNTVSVIHA